MRFDYCVRASGLFAHLHALELLLEALARGVVLQDQACDRCGQEPEEDLVPRVCMHSNTLDLQSYSKYIDVDTLIAF